MFDSEGEELGGMKLKFHSVLSFVIGERGQQIRINTRLIQSGFFNRAPAGDRSLALTSPSFSTSADILITPFFVKNDSVAILAGSLRLS